MKNRNIQDNSNNKDKKDNKEEDFVGDLE